MQDHGIFTASEAGDTRPGPAMGRESGRLRDAGWWPTLQSCAVLPSSGPAQLLHAWAPTPEPRVLGLSFQPLDGNPRHGVLALVSAAGELHGAIEILERQGRWLVMPDGPRARTLPRTKRPGALRSMAGTPDRRFIFFNTVRDGSLATWVERRRDGATVIT